jgi:hypothetical protein
VTPAPERPYREREAYDAGRLAGFEEGIEAATVTHRAAAPTTDAGLDVERLARALDNVYGSLEWMGDPLSKDAARIAAEYAALSRQAEKETA